jgi:hypothetical protein
MVSQPSPEPLVLTDAQPVQVYCQPFLDENNRLVAAFASSSNGQFFFGGLEWQMPLDTDTALFIHFNFLPNGTFPTITSIDCDAPIPLLYSPVGSNAVSQDGAIPPIRGDYRFYVNFSNGLKHDPQIVVTPQ